jgi:hypothetical protein
MKYIVVSAVRKRLNADGRRAGSEFLEALDRHVARLLDDACAVHNGGKKTLDSSVAIWIGITKR